MYLTKREGTTIKQINTKDRNLTIPNTNYRVIICPLCEKWINRSNAAIHSHLRTHIKNKEITIEERMEIMIQLLRRGTIDKKY